jgi:hypothetical protein
MRDALVVVWKSTVPAVSPGQLWNLLPDRVVRHRASTPGRMTPLKTTPAHAHPARLRGVVASRLNPARVAAAEPAHDRVAFIWFVEASTVART